MSYRPKKVYDLVYDDEKYTDTVQTRVFDFLYKLTQSEPVVGIKPVIALLRPSAIRMGDSNLSFSVSRGEGLEYAVVDLRGRVAMAGRISAGESVDLSALNNGVYVLRVQGERALRFGIKK